MDKHDKLQFELEVLRRSVLEMFVRAESMMRLAIRSVRQRDASLGRSVVIADKDVNQLELDIDRGCTAVLAKYRLGEEDLRVVITILKMVTDLERVGDLTVNIAHRGLTLSASPGIQPPEQVLAMGDIVADMLRFGAEAFVSYEKKLLSKMQKRDSMVDELNREVFEFGIAAMQNYPEEVERALAVTSISKYIERAGDHVVNLAEQIVLMVKGKDLRHQG
jgi:phosphate transport system protein